MKSWKKLRISDMTGFLAQILKLLCLLNGSGSSALEQAESRSPNRPSNALICREAWELQKIRASEAQEGYFQVRASGGIVASFASGGAIAAAVALISVAKDSVFGLLGFHWNIAWWCFTFITLVLLVSGAYLSLRSTFTNKLRDHSHPNLIAQKKGGYSSEAEFYLQLIANTEGYIEDHREATKDIGRHLKIGVKLLLGSMFLSLGLSLFLINISNLSGLPETQQEQKQTLGANGQEKITAMQEEQNPNTEEPMPPPQKPMPAEIIEEGDKKPLTIKESKKENQ